MDFIFPVYRLYRRFHSADYLRRKGKLSSLCKRPSFLSAGILVVAGITWLNGRTGNAAMDLGQFSLSLGIRLFFIGMFAISAMFLPGISGSTLLLIFGAYLIFLIPSPLSSAWLWFWDSRK